jgi:arylsulfatase A-like enzyme
VGVFATVLDLVGLEPPPDLQVASLVGVIEGKPGGGPAISERHKAPLRGDTEGGDPLVGTDQRFRSYREGNWKLIETSKGGRHLFDLVSDPSESINLAEAAPGDLQRLRSELDDWRSLFALPSIDGVVEHGAVPDLDPAAEQRLRELGYIE